MNGREALAERLRAEVHVDEAHGFPPGYGVDDLADAILADGALFIPSHEAFMERLARVLHEALSAREYAAEREP